MSLTQASEYEVQEKIGHGSFGVIRKVKRKADGLILCRKEINYGKMSQKEREQLHAEFQCLSSLRHPNIVAYYHRDHLKAGQELHLYMEYCGNGDLGRVIKDLAQKGHYATESFVWSVLSQLVSALYRCHYGADPEAVGSDLFSDATRKKPPANGMVIMHRDLKPENVFLGQDNSVKLGDFGLSKMIESHDFASTYVGTPYYMSPEICAAERYTLKSDIWSLGCIIYELCSREPPFNAKTHYQLVQKIKEGKVAPLPDVYSSELSATIRDCLHTNPDKRPSTYDLLQRPIIRLMRKEKEVSDFGQLLKMREQELDQQRDELAKQVANFDAKKIRIRHELDATLRREWELKAQLEISRHINSEVEELHRQFEAEVQIRVQAELAKRAAASNTTVPSDSPLDAERPCSPPDSNRSSVEPSESTCPAAALPTARSNTPAPAPVAADVPAVTAAIDNLEVAGNLAKRTLGTPLRRVQTMFTRNVATPQDIEMSEPSPMAISSLSLSPRRNATTKVPNATGGNIFEANAARNLNTTESQWALRDSSASGDSDDEEIIPSPTRRIKSNKNPFMAKHRPVLSCQKSATNKALPKLPVIQSTPEFRPVRDPRERPASPLRRLSKIPSAASLVPKPTENSTNVPCSTPGGLTRKPSVNKKEEVSLNKVVAKNNIIRGRSLVELQQARAGGRPLSAVIAPGGENVSPKRLPKDGFRERRASGSEGVAVWDPEKDEMPSPFIARSKYVSRV